MRAFLALAILLTGCGPSSAILGTWRYALETNVPTAAGPVSKMVTFDLDIGSTASPDLVVWKIGGGCNVPMPLAGKVATLDVMPPLCGLSAGALIPMIGDTGTPVKLGDQLGVNAARFELMEDGKLSTSFEYKLFTDLKDARVGPLFQVTSPAGKHGTRVK